MQWLKVIVTLYSKRNEIRSLVQDFKVIVNESGCEFMPFDYNINFSTMMLFQFTKSYQKRGEGTAMRLQNNFAEYILMECDLLSSESSDYCVIRSNSRLWVLSS